MNNDMKFTRKKDQMPHPRVLVQKNFKSNETTTKLTKKKETEGKVDSIKYSQSFKLDPFSAYIYIYIYLIRTMR